MVFLRTDIDLNSASKKAKVLILECNECGIKFRRKFSSEQLNKNLHYCSVSCRGVGTGKKNSETYWNKTDEERECLKQINSESVSKAWKVMPNETKERIAKKNSENMKRVHANMTEEERVERYGKIKDSLNNISDEERRRRSKNMSRIKKEFWDTVSDEYIGWFSRTIKSAMKNISKERWEEMISKKENTVFQKYGVRCGFLVKDEDGVFKRSKTNLSKFGVDHYSKTNEFSERVRERNILLYGVESFFQTEIFKDKRMDKFIEKYGVDFLKTEEFIEKMINSFIENHGNGKTGEITRENWSEFIDWGPISKKRHETMKRNGTYGETSKPEKLAQMFLAELFGDINIENQKVQNKRWSIDHYVLSLGFFVQTDGVYWHGLDRPLNEIKEFKTERDKTIYQHFLNDQKRAKWFLENNKLLVKVTDIEVNSCTNKWDYLNILRSKLSENKLTVQASIVIKQIDKMLEER